MADQDYPHLYAQLEASAERAVDAAVSFETMLGGDENQTVPVNGFGEQPTLAKRVKDRIDEISETVESEALATINNLAAATDYVAPEIEYLVVVDDEGAKAATLTERRLATLPFDLSSVASPSSEIGDGEGAVAFYADQVRALLGPLEIQVTPQPGVFVTDADGAVLQDMSRPGVAAEDPSASSPFRDGVLFAPVVATFEGSGVEIYPQNLIPRRDRADNVVSVISSTTGGTNRASDSGRAIRVSAKEYGATATLQMRSKLNPSDHRYMNLSLKNVPVQSPTKALNILFIGDSIGNRFGGRLLRQFLEPMGFVPSFIGTLQGSGNPTNSNDDTGEMGECREGWETGDFTYAVTDRVSIVPPGGEAAYLALPKLSRWPSNPFLRASISSDPAAIIRNGYVFDPAFYQTRFSLPTPDVVINMVGTNDARDRLASAIYGQVLSNDTLMHNQIKAAWPNAKIIRGVPGTAIDTDRNLVWTSHYVPMIRAIQDAAAAVASSNLTVAPVWAMADPETGYFVSGTPDATGFISGNWQDPIHPINASRAALYQALAGYVGAAAINLI